MACSLLATLFQLLAVSALAIASPCTKTCPADVNDRLVAETTSGRVIGHVAQNTSCVVEYLGIPYAKPPIGQLRFAAPEKILGPPSTYEAAKYGFDCPSVPSGAPTYPNLTPQAARVIRYFAGAAGTTQSEDCLTLNVWSRSSAVKQTTAAKKPVLVFFHGGRFAIGNTNSPMYTGKYLAEAEDVVVVTVTYRLNIFGFPGAPGEKTQNLGIRDQRIAVEWVRDNAAAFGGDPARITLSGQSSGGVAVDYWTYAYQNDPIAHGIVATSGNAFSFPVNTPGIPERNWNTVVAAVGCGAAADKMACMRVADWAVINAAAGAVRPSASSSVLRSVPPFYPIPDGEIVFADYVARTTAGKYARVPVLMGHNHNEDGYYRIPAFRNGVIPTPAQVSSFLLESFTCPVSYQSRARMNASVPAFAYRFVADWDNTRLFSTSGAYHGVDLHMVFGGSEETSGLPPSRDQKQLTKMMQRMWASFSTDPKQGLTKALGWPAFDADKKTLAVFGRDNAPGVSYVKPSEFDAPCLTVVMGALSTAV